MTALLPGPYGRKQDKTMIFPDHLVRRNADRYAEVLMEDELCGPDGISAHFWVYPAAPVERLKSAVANCKNQRDIVRWQWDFMPKRALPQVLHYHLREVILRGTKASSYLYLFAPSDVFILGEIYDAYKVTWSAVAASPVGDGDLLHYPREFAHTQIDAGNVVAETLGRPPSLKDLEAYYVDVQARELTWLLNISNDILSATAGTGTHTRKKADLSQDRRHAL